MQIQGFAVWTQDSETRFVWHGPYCARVVMPRPSELVSLVTLWHDSLAHKNNVCLGAFRGSCGLL